MNLVFFIMKSSAIPQEHDGHTAHRAMLTPVSPLLARLIHISPRCWTIYRSFENILGTGSVPWIGLQIQCSIQIHCFKKHSVRYELCFKKYLIAQGSSGSDGWTRVKRKRTKSRERLPPIAYGGGGHCAMAPPSNPKNKKIYKQYSAVA